MTATAAEGSEPDADDTPWQAKRYFNRLWAGEAASAFGTRISHVALPLIAVVVLHAPAWQVGLLTAAEGFCYLGFGLHAGAWVDRWRRRPVLIASSLLRCVLVALIPIAAALHLLSLGLLVVVAFGVSALTMFFDLALFAFVPLVLGRSRLNWGNARLNGTDSVAQVAGPTVASVLIGALTAPYAMAVDAVSYLASALGAFLVPIPEARRTTEPGTSRRPIRQDILEGLRFLRGEKLLLILAGVSASYNFFATGTTAVLVPHLVHEAGLGTTGVSIVFAVSGIGGVIGAALTGRLANRSPATALWAFPTACLFGGLLLPWGDGWVAGLLAGIGGAFTGMGIVVYNTTATSLRQSRTPSEMLGRLRSALRTTAWSGATLGALAGGALASAASPKLTLVIGSIGGLLVFLAAGLTPMRTVTQADTEAARPS
ncbi:MULTISPECIES: MFS transporter [unclassified Streptomyces]|uniref:MFS transporter n=1 Tax=unclassified Streptomyces TaxID=2593676 RepID=UPI000DACF4EB|nr:MULTISPECIES: MFS transporter [unclassified Streptomyces]PZT77246.1 MFS transporter [Streptomyces sp. AC1-42W]PZT78802.1 MFS transporter [Streptomyces sp. AC1-42T]